VRNILRRLARAERGLMHRSAQSRSPALDRSLVTLTRAADYSRLWLLIAGALAAFGGSRGRRAASHGLVSLGLAALVANGPAKLLVRRRRPLADTALIRMPRSTSFPSGHSASAFAFAAGASRELPALSPLLFPLAGAVAYSRTHTGVHYPGDVAAGMAIGVACAALSARVIHRD
jgi:undecaprenyl-diphosphatase